MRARPLVLLTFLVALTSCSDPQCEIRQKFTFTAPSKSYDLSEYVSSVDCADGFIIVRLTNDGAIKTLHLTRRHDSEQVRLSYGNATRETVFLGGGYPITVIQIPK